MHATILFQLQQTLERLQAQQIPIYKAEDQLGLRVMLVSTIRNLRGLHAETGASSSTYLLLRRIDLLEQEVQTLARPGKVALGSWNLLHTYLTATLEATLSTSAPVHQAETIQAPPAEAHPQCTVLPQE
ncbi:hypothetical protein [Hymenobacter volaticus]|uniref:Uncharacterized protein n=1 Tax=Hymenobacter volaticus TaxID=2932254 RepID=A0ABY4GBP3_9BACT|nr:hypothetical protein [Hymenobacter volaticus]UOQ68338.1 hypothetical protein MUN86_11075 [Hymenobacter volaticus]